MTQYNFKTLFQSSLQNLPGLIQGTGYMQFSKNRSKPSNRTLRNHQQLTPTSPNRPTKRQVNESGDRDPQRRQSALSVNPPDTCETPDRWDLCPDCSGSGEFATLDSESNICKTPCKKCHGERLVVAPVLVPVFLN